MKLSRLFLAATFAVCAVAFVPAATQTAAAKAPPVRYYLALGDSLSAGFQNHTIATDRACADATNDLSGHEGYVCLLYRKLLTVYPNLKVVNLGLAASPGEDTCSFTTMTTCFGFKPRVDTGLGDVAPYNINQTSQMAAALAFLKTHRHAAPIITIDLGGNDFLPLLGMALKGDLADAVKALPATETTAATNLNMIVKTLHKAAPKARIALVNQYDPFSGMPAGAIPTQLAAFITQALTQWSASVLHIAVRYHTAYADVYTAFLGQGPVLTNILGPIDYPNIHCNDLGYTKYTDVVEMAYVRGPI